MGRYHNIVVIWYIYIYDITTDYIVGYIYIYVYKPLIYIINIWLVVYLQDRAPKIAKLVYKWLNNGLWQI